MNIVYASDNNYADIMGVSVVSLFENNKDVPQLTIFILDDNISLENKSKLISIAASYQRGMSFFAIPDIEELCGTKIEVQQWAMSAFARLFLTAILPEDIEKVLYIDCDTIALQSIAGLYEEEIDDYYGACVLDYFGELPKKAIGLKENSPYFNSGIFLMNIKKMREDDVEAKFKKFILLYNGHIPCVDQGVINGTIGDKIKVISPIYNVMTLNFCFPSYRSFYRVNRPIPYYNETEFERAKDNPVIIHFTQGLLFSRPWIEGCKHLYAKEWLLYKAMSPWSDAPPRKNQAPLKKRVMYKLRELWYMLPVPYSVRQVVKRIKAKITNRRILNNRMGS